MSSASCRHPDNASGVLRGLPWQTNDQPTNIPVTKMMQSEQARRAYLRAMGIDVWIPRDQVDV
ncbi:MAG: hypothetical protein OEQ30_07885, partial [Gammaproteobacteria bacterium]|nr:hypothetical protein [Gammaproteobacteria bacterium]